MAALHKCILQRKVFPVEIALENSTYICYLPTSGAEVTDLGSVSAYMVVFKRWNSRVQPLVLDHFSRCIDYKRRTQTLSMNLFERYI